MAAETEESKVTTEKIKNPGRQEWGRKLGKMSKELKLKNSCKKLCMNSRRVNMDIPLDSNIVSH